jgi:hypothetical protein
LGGVGDWEGHFHPLEFFFGDPSEEVSLNSLSFALIFISTTKFDFYTASTGGAMKLDSCQVGAPSEEVSLSLSYLSVSLSCFEFYSHG